MTLLLLLLPILPACVLVYRRADKLAATVTTASLLIALAGYWYAGGWQDLLAVRLIQAGMQQKDPAPEVSLHLVAYLQQKIAQRPMEPMLWYQLGLEQLKARQPRAALRTFEQLAERTDDETVKQTVALLKAQLEASAK